MKLTVCMALFNPILKDADVLLMLRACLNRIRTTVVEKHLVPALIEASASPVYSVKGSLLLAFW